MGRHKTDTGTLLKRGSPVGVARVKKQAKKRQKRVSKPKSDFPAIKLLTSKQIQEGIPGYDSAKGADDYKFVYAKAKKAILFFHNELKHVKGEKARTPFYLEPWEQAIIGNIFGWVHKQTKLRRYRTAFIMVPKKNGKTPLAAGILCYLLFEDGEPGAEIYGAASEYKQASLVFTHAWGMRNQNPRLRETSHVFKGQSKAMEIGEPGEDTYGIYRVISSEADNIEGANTHAAVIDELHKQDNRDLVDNLETSTAARRQPLIIYITTRDFDRESICNEKEEYAFNVRDGLFDDPTFLPVLYCAEPEDDWTKPETWRKANPNLGVSVKEDFIRNKCEEAQWTPTLENTFKRLHLDMKTAQDIRWLPMDAWDDCGAEPIVAEALIGHDCFAGLDLSSVRDLTAFVLWFPHEQKVLPYFWLPEAEIEYKEKRDGVPYRAWAKEGYLTLTPGNTIDYNVVMADIKHKAELYDIQGIGFDRWAFEAIRQKLIAEGIPEELMIAVGQGYASMSAPSKLLEKLVTARELQHGGHPVLRWMAQNVTAAMDPAGNIKPDKGKSKHRIDGIVGLVIALALASMQPAETDSIYESRGILAI